MLCLAVCAGTQAPCAERHNFYEWVPPDLGEVKPWQPTSLQQSDSVPLECLLDDLHNTIDLLNADHADTSQTLEV